MSDKTTIDAYNAKVDDYRQMVGSQQEDEALSQFMQAAPKGGHILDLGCGPGKSSAQLQSNGFSVDPIDASPAMVDVANEHFPINARLATFNSIDGENDYDGVWANFSLLHATRDDFPIILKALYKAIKPGGVLHLGMKTGSGAERDALGRFYTFYTQTELEDHLQQSGFKVVSMRTGKDIGLAGTEDPWATLLSTKLN